MEERGKRDKRKKREGGIERKKEGIAQKQI